MRHFRRRIPETQRVRPIQHSDSLTSNVGGATAPAAMVVLDTETGARTVTGSTQTIQVGMGTNEEVNTGSVVKYVNLFLQVATRPASATTENDANGWLEWAFVMVKETETAVPITNLGTQTLADVCTKMYRNECIYTGAIPVGHQQPNYVEIKIKVPRFKQRIFIGDQWRFVTFFRDTNTTSVETDSQRLIKSFMYKSYN